MASRGGGRRHFNRQPRPSNSNPNSHSPGTTRFGRFRGGSSSFSPHSSAQRGHRDYVAHTNVPKADQISTGAAVSIILKMDQPTGHQVQGFIAEVLGRGDHPRGIKVRLSDGRVGRVQRLASRDEAEAGTVTGGQQLGCLGRNGEVIGHQSLRPSAIPDGRGGRGRAAEIQYHDFRNDGHSYEDRPEANNGPNLMDYVKAKPTKRRGKGQASVSAVSERGGAEATPTPAEAASSSATEIGTELPAAIERLHAEGSEPKPLQSPRSSSAVFDSARSTCPVCLSFHGDEEAVAHHVASHFD